MWQFGYMDWRPRKGDDSYDAEILPGLLIHSCPICTTIELTWLFWSVFARHVSEDHINDEENGQKEEENYQGNVAGVL